MFFRQLSAQGCGIMRIPGEVARHGAGSMAGDLVTAGNCACAKTAQPQAMALPPGQRAGRGGFELISGAAGGELCERARSSR
jgi:hypothetical protein